MAGLLQLPLARRILASAGLGAFGDWVAFSALVALVAVMTDGSVFAVAIVTAARIVPSVGLGPLVAPYAGVFGARRTLVVGDLVRAGAILAVGTAGSVGALILALLALELAAALVTATRESVITAGIPRDRFRQVNTATGVLSYGMLPVGGVVAALVLQVGAIAPFLLAAAAYLGTAAIMGTAESAHLAGRPSSEARISATAGLHRLRTPGSLRNATTAAVIGVIGITMLFSTGTRMAERVLGSPTHHGLLLGLVAAGAVVGAVLAQRQIRAAAGMAIAAAGAALLLLTSGLPAIAGVVTIGCGAAIAYVATQAALQRAGCGPEDFAAAFAVIKVGALAALVAAPTLHVFGGLDAVLVTMAAASLSGAWFLATRVEHDPLRRPLPATIVLKPVGLAIRLGCRIQVAGRLPEGGAVIAANHPNALDGPLGVMLDPRVRPVAKPQRHPVARLGFLLAGALMTGTGATGSAVEHLRRGGYVWLAPEGRISGAVLGRPRSGVARIAAAAGVPIVPMAIRYDTPAGPRLRDWRPWCRPRAVITLGAPINVAANADMAAIADTVMRRLAAMLGQSYVPATGPLDYSTCSSVLPAQSTSASAACGAVNVPVTKVPSATRGPAAPPDTDKKAEARATMVPSALSGPAAICEQSPNSTSSSRLMASTGTGTVMVAAAASKVACTTASSSHPVNGMTGVSITPQLPRNRNGCSPGSRGNLPSSGLH